MLYIPFCSNFRFFLASFYTKYDSTHFCINLVALGFSVIPKLPQLHGVRIFNINKWWNPVTRLYTDIQVLKNTNHIFLFSSLQGRLQLVSDQPEAVLELPYFPWEINIFEGNCGSMVDHCYVISIVLFWCPITQWKNVRIEW